MVDTEQIAHMIPIQHIRPDPEQPRRLLSADLAQSLAAGSSPFYILEQLRARSKRNKWIRVRLHELDALAQSIADNGLMQPIRVIRDSDDRYRIEEGERRWWAHHILVQQGNEQFQHIAAFVVDKDSASAGLLRRRIAENVQRSDFTAIEVARAMANRIQEILAAESGIKRGDAERRVGGENGMSDRRVRQFVALLTLSPEAQELAQQARLTENTLRKIVGIKDSASQLAAIRELTNPSQRRIKTSREPRVEKSPYTSSHPHRDDRRRRKHGLPKRCISARRGKYLVRALPHKKTSRADLKDSALRRMDQLLAFAKSFNANGLKKLDRDSWILVARSEVDRQALLSLNSVLAHGLALIKRTNRRGTARKDE